MPTPSMDVVLWTSAARTATVTSVDIPSSRKEAIHLTIVVSSAGTGSITPSIQGKDANGNYYDILVGSAITTTGTNVLKIGRGMTPSPNNVATDQLPYWFRVILTANNSNPMTYTAAAQLM